MNRQRQLDRIGVGIIGAGGFARSVLLPALSRTKANMVRVADINGVFAAQAARKFGIGEAVSDYRRILDDTGIQAVFILVGHHLHARFVCEALEAGKHVFVEKPLAITEAELEEVMRVYRGGMVRQAHHDSEGGMVRQAHHDKNHDTSGVGLDQGDKVVAPRQARGDKEAARVDMGVAQAGKDDVMVSLSNHDMDKQRQGDNSILMVGFNRRFSPHVVRIKQALAGRAAPLCMTMTVNAGFIPPEHWVQDPLRGGGRIIGEGCHFIDLLAFLAGSPVTAVSAMMVGGNGPIRDDKMSIVLGFADGSVGTVNYFANGAKSYPKETLEVFGDGRVIRMDNFQVTKGHGFKGFRTFRTWRQDKGHRAEVAAFLERVASGGEAPIAFDQIVNVTRASFAAVEAARTGKVIAVSY